MTVWKLAWLNFKNGFKNYLSLVISMAFTVLVFMNFQNLIYSEVFQVLGEHNREYIEVLVQVVSFVLACFMFFFTEYATSVFLTRRKKEIGTYVFMGLSNQKIGKLYSIETLFTGLTALGLGIGTGILTAGLFQMILVTLAGLTVEVHFFVSAKPVLVTTVIYLVIYLFFVLKGYANIARSSVLSMISAARQNEYVRQNRLILLVKAVFGCGILGMGYSLAVRRGGPEILGHAFEAVVLVTLGVYLLFGGLIPLCFQTLAENKRFLYQKERILWVNRVIFRMKKNYRTYAIVSVLILCSVTALAMGFAMRERYENIIQFEQVYTFQLLSSRDDLADQAERIIREYTDIQYQGEAPILTLDTSDIVTGDFYNHYAVLPYSAVRKLAGSVSLEWNIPEPGDDEIIRVSRLYLLSLLTDRSGRQVTIGGKVYRQTGETSEPYLGYLQEQVSFYMVSDREYERLRPLGQELYTFNYKISDPAAFQAVKERLGELVDDRDGEYTARVAIDPEKNDLDWVRVLYPFCIFMFLVFLMSSGSMMFMKVYNDAFEERERCRVMGRMGVEESVLGRAIAWELGMAYGLAFLVMAVSSWFSVRALANMMYADLTGVNVVSVLVVFMILLFCYGLSVAVYKRNSR